jgi:hypothetical protein
VGTIGTLVAGDAVPTNTILGNGANEKTIADNLVVTRDLAVHGTITTSNPFWVAGQVNGTSLSEFKSRGRYGFTVSRPAGFGTCVYNVGFDTPAPDASDVVYVKMGGSQTPTTEGFHIVSLNQTWSLVSCDFHYFALVNVEGPIVMPFSYNLDWVAGNVGSTGSVLTLQGIHGYTVTKARRVNTP